MAKKCGVTLCKRLAQSHGYCFIHGYMRTDEKYLMAKEKKKQKESPRHISVVPTGEMSIAKLISILDKLFSEYMRRKDGDIAKCCTCDVIASWKSFEYGHLIPRDHDSTRFHEQNGGPQCHFCNCHRGGEEKKMEEYLANRYGADAVAELKRLKHVVKHWTRSELLDMIKFYRNELKKFN